MGTVVNNYGVALAGQRSDDWILEETPSKLDVSDENSKRQVANQLRKVLEQADLERRIQEGGATIAELKPALEKAHAAGKKKNAADARKPPAGAQQ